MAEAERLREEAAAQVALAQAEAAAQVEEVRTQAAADVEAAEQRAHAAATGEQTARADLERARAEAVDQ